MTINENLNQQSLQQAILRLLPEFGKKFAEEKSIALFAAFILSEEYKGLELDWALPIIFLKWLAEHSDYSSQVTDQMKKEMLIAAATRWSMQGLEHISVKGILLYSPHYPNYAIGFKKNSVPEEMGKISLLKLSAEELPSTESYSLCFDDESWDLIFSSLRA